MTEIIIAIILHLATIVGVPTEKEEKEKTNEKEKIEKPIKGTGGTGNWDDN